MWPINKQECWPILNTWPLKGEMEVQQLPNVGEHCDKFFPLTKGLNVQIQHQNKTILKYPYLLPPLLTIQLD